MRKALESLENSLKNTKGCTACGEHLAWVYYYQSRYGMRDDFSRFRDYTRKLLKQDGDNPTLLFLLGNVALAERDGGEAIATLKRFLLQEGTKPEWQTQARNLLAQAQREFLKSWYGQADFYSKVHYNIAEALQNRIATITALQKQLAGPGGTTQAKIGATTRALQDLSPQGKEGFQWTPNIEMQLGAQALSSSKDTARPVQDPKLQKYVQDLVLKLVDKTPGPPYSYRIDVLDTDAVNAFAVPGSVMVNRGLIRFAQNEAELVVVLAHELGHNYAHHMARM